MHTFRSDGHQAPAIVAAEYRKNGYDFLALTDHRKYNYINFAPETGITLIPGMEIDGTFDRENGYLDYGVLGVDRSPYYAKIAYQFDAMATAADGTVLIGESDRRAKLFLFVPGGEIMPGVLNPTNPR